MQAFLVVSRIDFLLKLRKMYVLASMTLSFPKGDCTLVLMRVSAFIYKNWQS